MNARLRVSLTNHIQEWLTDESIARQLVKHENILTDAPEEYKMATALSSACAAVIDGMRFQSYVSEAACEIQAEEQKLSHN